jgi:hypothetical protein
MHPIHIDINTLSGDYRRKGYFMAAQQTIIEFLSHLRGLDVRVWSDGDQLRASAPDGILTPELQAELKERKTEILAFLGNAREAAQSTPAIQPAAREGKLPLSYTQQQLWFLDQLDPGNAAYNMPVVARLAKDKTGRPFDLSRGPLIRCGLLRLGDDPITGASEHILLLTTHHIISDGWSMGILFREIMLLYRAYADGRRSSETSSSSPVPAVHRPPVRIPGRCAFGAGLAQAG